MRLNLSDCRFSDDIVQMIGEIDEFKGFWKVYCQAPDERLKELKRRATVESVGSSTRIEGSQMTDTEVSAVLRGNSSRFDSKDAKEVAGCGFVLQEILQSWKDMPLTENIIKQLHRDLMRYCDADASHRGEYKKLNNHVAAFRDGKLIGIVSRTATVFETPMLMSELVEWFNRQLDEKRVHPLIAIGMFVVTFLMIHPFQDGNGRLSRALTTLLLMRSGYTYTPFSSLERAIEETQQSYYASLHLTQKTISTEAPRWEPWLFYFLRSIKRQIKVLEKSLDLQVAN